MFLGTIPPALRSIVAETVGSWPDQHELYVACCGNFTIERSVQHLGLDLHSSDVSIYTSAIGRWLTGKPVGIMLREESREELGWIEKYLDDGVGTVATMMLGTRFLASLGKPGAWHERTVRGWKAQFERAHADTVAKLTASDIKIASYEAIDVRELLWGIPPDAPLASFPPFYGGGYETMWKPLDTHFTWDAPEYQVLSEGDVTALVEKMADRPYWVLATNHEVEALNDHYRGMVKSSNRGAPHFVYGTIGHSRLATPRQKLEPVLQPRLKPGEEIGDRLALAPLRDGQLNALRSQYLNPRIAPGQCDVAYAVLCDGQLIGVVGYSLQGGPGKQEGWAYLLTDFAVAPTDYPRLSKLVVLAATSREAQQLLQRAWSRRYVGVSTTAFSNNPVSMKYRGILTLDKRGESKDPQWKYALNYSAPLGEHTLAEALDTWKQKWGAPRAAQEA